MQRLVRQASAMDSPASATSQSVRDRISGSLWGLFMGDALAMPTHWYYGGKHQIMAEFGGPITKMTKSRPTFRGSIMNLSNTGGAGRGSDQGDIIGDVINHGKKQYWLHGKSYHYHHTLEAGENTLETQLCRVLMKSVVSNGGEFSASSFQEAYIKFMTTPGSHNDCYASTCHRMFFENLVMRKKPPAKCPSNDGHNVDTMDGLVLPTVVALATVNKPRQEASEAISACVATTRNSSRLVDFAEVMTDLVRSVVSEGVPLPTAAVAAGKQMGVDVRRSPGQLMTA